jgi:hypothetical protein
VGHRLSLTHKITYEIFTQTSIQGWIRTHECNVRGIPNGKFLKTGDHLVNAKCCFSWIIYCLENVPKYSHVILSKPHTMEACKGYAGKCSYVFDFNTRYNWVANLHPAILFPKKTIFISLDKKLSRPRAGLDSVVIIITSWIRRISFSGL